MHGIMYTIDLAPEVHAVQYSERTIIAHNSYSEHPHNYSTNCGISILECCLLGKNLSLHFLPTCAAIKEVDRPVSAQTGSK